MQDRFDQAVKSARDTLSDLVLHAAQLQQGRIDITQMSRQDLTAMLRNLERVSAVLRTELMNRV